MHSFAFWCWGGAEFATPKYTFWETLIILSWLFLRKRLRKKLWPFLKLPSCSKNEYIIIDNYRLIWTVWQTGEKLVGSFYQSPLCMAQQRFIYQTFAFPSPCKLPTFSLKSQTTTLFFLRSRLHLGLNGPMFLQNLYMYICN